MLTYFTTPVRSLLLAAALVFAGQAAEARSSAPDRTQTVTTRSTARTKTDMDAADRDGVPIEGFLLIVGIVGALIVFAWVGSRIGDNRPTMMV